MLSWWYSYLKLVPFFMKIILFKRFSNLLCDFDVTKNILKHKTLKSLLLEVLKSGTIMYASLKIHFVSFEDKTSGKSLTFLKDMKLFSYKSKSLSLYVTKVESWRQDIT